MRINLNRTIDIDRRVLIDFVSDLGYEDEIAEQGDSFIREFVQDWIWFSGSGSLEDRVARYELAHERGEPVDETF